MMQDETMRARLLALAEQEPLPRLDAAARARAEAAAQRVWQRQAQRRAWGLGALAAAGLAASGLLLLHFTATPQLARVAVHVEAGAEQKAPLAQPPVRTCAEHAAATWVPTSDLTQRLDLGARALLVASGAARVGHALSPACDVRVQLDDGSVAVHARDLRGGELVIHTPSAEVVVKGTVFEVTLRARDQQARVAVDEGRVEVRTPAGVFVLGPGQRLTLGARPLRDVFSLAARALLRTRLGLPATQVAGPSRAASGPDELPQAAPLPAEPLAETRAWRSGTLPVPRVPPEPGSSVTEQGRPWAKPRLIDAGLESEPGEEP